MRAVRIIEGTVLPEGASTHDRKDELLMQGLGVKHVATRVQSLRLLYLGRLLVAAPVSLVALVQASTEWQDTMSRDLSDVHRTTRKLDALPPPCVSMAPWMELIGGFPQAWRALVKSTEVPRDRLIKQEYFARRADLPGRGDLPASSGVLNAP
eukprot:8980433-Alexandrium_andersonii.AAC.1